MHQKLKKYLSLNCEPVIVQHLVSLFSSNYILTNYREIITHDVTSKLANSKNETFVVLLQLSLQKIKIFVHAVEPLVATNSRKRPPLLSDQFSKISKVSNSNHHIWNLLIVTTSYE